VFLHVLLLPMQIPTLSPVSSAHTHVLSALLLPTVLIVRVVISCIVIIVTVVALLDFTRIMGLVICVRLHAKFVRTRQHVQSVLIIIIFKMGLVSGHVMMGTMEVMLPSLTMRRV
jgi:hypothetical protein